MFKLAYFVDMPSLLCIILFNFPILAAMGLLKPFIHSFSYIVRKKGVVPVKDLKKSYEAVNMVMKLMLYTSLLVTLFYWVIIFSVVREPQVLGANIAVSLLTLLYTMFIEVILLPVSVRLKMILDESLE